VLEEKGAGGGGSSWAPGVRRKKDLGYERGRGRKEKKEVTTSTPAYLLPFRRPPGGGSGERKGGMRRGGEKKDKGPPPHPPSHFSLLRPGHRRAEAKKKEKPRIGFEEEERKKVRYFPSLTSADIEKQKKKQKENKKKKGRINGWIPAPGYHQAKAWSKEKKRRATRETLLNLYPSGQKPQKKGERCHREKKENGNPARFYSPWGRGKEKSKKTRPGGKREERFTAQRTYDRFVLSLNQHLLRGGDGKKKKKELKGGGRREQKKGEEDGVSGPRSPSYLRLPWRLRRRRGKEKKILEGAVKKKKMRELDPHFASQGTPESKERENKKPKRVPGRASSTPFAVPCWSTGRKRGDGGEQEEGRKASGKPSLSIRLYANIREKKK